MSDARIEFGLANLSFAAQGSETWVSEQFAKVIEQIDKLDLPTADAVGRAPENITANPAAAGPANSQLGSITLVSFLQKCDASSNANRKFIATALWTMKKQGKTTFTTRDVTTALNAAQQSRLANPSQSLARVTKAGFAELSSNGEYYVTPEGRKELGLQEEGT